MTSKPARARLNALVDTHFAPTWGAGAPRNTTPEGAPGSTPDAGSCSPEPQPLGDLAQWQIEIGTARAALLSECLRMADSLNFTVAQAESVFVQQAKVGSLPQDLLDLMRAAHARRGERSTISTRCLARWRERASNSATPTERIARLAPRTRGKRWQLDQDVAAALGLYRRPNKPALRWCAAQIAGGLSAPEFAALYARCRREIAKLPKALFYVGRNSGAALKALQPFRRREFLSLHPNDVWIGDGHSAKLRIAHPDTGNPFVPEVTVILDVATRYAVGWSVALSENCIAVCDALRHAVSRHGSPLIYYSDGGGGQKNKMFDAPLTGIFVGLGIHHETGRPNHPQARGVIERLWPTVLLPLARRFATYQGRGADRDTLRRVTIEIDRHLRAAQRGEISTLPKRLPTFQQFIDVLEAEIEAYNTTHRHRSLPKLDGREHATPAEYRAARLVGADLQVPQPQEVAALFMPSVLRVAARGEVKLWNSTYPHSNLMLVDREEVRVCFDIHDASYVLLRRLSGEFIGRAESAGNRSGYMPKSLIERLRDERAARRRKLLESKLAEVAVERNAATLPARFTPEERAALEAEMAAPTVVNVLELRSDADKHAHWRSLDERRAAGEQLDGQDAEFHAAWPSSVYFRLARQEDAEFERMLAERNARHSAAALSATKVAIPNHFLRTKPRVEPSTSAEEVERAARARLRKSGPRVMRRGPSASSSAGRTTDRRASRKNAR